MPDDLDPFFAPEFYAFDELVLRPYRPGDGPMLSEAILTSLDHLQRFLPWAGQDHGPRACEHRARQFRARYLTGQDFVMGVFLADGQTLVGGTGFHPRGAPVSRRTSEIGMWIRASHAGRGIATRVLRAMLTWGFTEWPWLRLTWHASAGNTASLRTAMRVGMTREGVLRQEDYDPDGQRRDLVIYAMLRSEWSGATDPDA